MDWGNRKDVRSRVARVLPRGGARIVARLEASGENVVEGIAGMWIGAALASLVAWGALADITHYMTGEIAVRPPDHLCRPLIGQGLYLDGDSVAFGADTTLVCDGYSGGWEPPDERAQRLARLIGAPVLPME